MSYQMASFVQVSPLFNSLQNGERRRVPFSLSFTLSTLPVAAAVLTPPSTHHSNAFFGEIPPPTLSPCLFRSPSPPIPKAETRCRIRTQCSFSAGAAACTTYTDGRVPWGRRRIRAEKSQGASSSSSSSIHCRFRHPVAAMQVRSLPISLSQTPHSPRTPTQFDSKTTKGPRGQWSVEPCANKRFPASKPKQIPGIAGQW